MRYFFSFLAVLLIPIGYFSFSPDHGEYAVFESSLSGAHFGVTQSGMYRIDASVSFDSPRTAFYFSFPREQELLDSGVTVVWHTISGDIERTLDTEDIDMLGYDTRIFSTPWITNSHLEMSFSIISPVPLDPGKLTLMTSYSEGGVKSGINTVSAATRVISRAEWGADERYRYADSDDQKQIYQEYLMYRQAPKTQTQIDSINTDIERDQELNRLFPDTEKYVNIQRYENGHRLVWPIQKTRQVNRIIIHHTAESLDKQASDEVYLRDIYKYHAVTRGWGDIGYNYIVGQRGAIYEGRAGGDYVVGAHTPANNEGSVGISVIGNFENIHLNRDQRIGLETAISYVAEKYGITLSSRVPAVYSCKFTKTCDHVETHLVNALSGHRDYNPTACPGANIYSELPGFISKLNRIYAPVYNPESPYSDPIPADEVMNMTLIPSVTEVPSPLNISKKSRKSPNIRIRLSYSGTTALLEGATVSPAIAKIGLRKVAFNQGFQANVNSYGKNQVVIQIKNRTYTGSSFSLEGEVVRIASWSRIPAWDTIGKYNDNVFRGKLIVRNDNGKLFIVNELPVEDYLKGMGEVSNSDLPEKIKTIIVSARSYGYYYMDKTHRKYNTVLYDGSDDPDSFQKYLGYGYEMRSPNVAKLVDATFGQVVKYQGELIKTWYFSSSDGQTRSYREYCESNGSKNCMNIPYLVSVSDPGGVGKVRSGHGVGISGVGATYFAREGWDYKKIIQYYLNGVEILKK